ncbi:MAG: tRNA pseudouridine(38-40) synthase TruA [Chloroflexi bacterium]|nr:tRNA pseudouridine(38-40) synthase TruA [Chloroflexota bacterium]MCL5275619.1 tRNA pseudouridine(38-40) synthase TruA [Chloroflexota bacterium]
MRATVAYDGTNFHGFQRQANARSVQGELEEALDRTCGETISVIGAGRTDAGVHASGQVIAFNTTWQHGLADLQNALNVRLPQDVAIVNLAECAEEFHPRYSAHSRTYQYTVAIGRSRQPLLRLYAWQLEYDLDVVQMNRAAEVLIGEHDFAAFGAAPQGDSTVREVKQASWSRLPATDELAAAIYRFTIEANAFLFRMVRRVVMTMIQAGRRRLSVEDIRDILASRDSQRIKGIAPACGLCLVKVTY